MHDQGESMRSDEYSRCVIRRLHINRLHGLVSAAGKVSLRQ